MVTSSGSELSVFLFCGVWPPVLGFRGRKRGRRKFQKRRLFGKKGGHNTGQFLRPHCGTILAAVFWFHVLFDSYWRDHFGGHNVGPFWRPLCGTILAATMWPPFFRSCFPAVRFLAVAVFFFGRGCCQRSRPLVSTFSRRGENSELPHETSSRGVPPPGSFVKRSACLRVSILQIAQASPNYTPSV